MKQGWEIKKMGEVCESDLGKTLNQSKDTGELHPYLCAINILWDKIDFSTIKQTKFEESELERYSVRKGDLLICEGGDIGRAAIWNKDEAMLYQNALHRVRFDGSVVPRFCLLYLRFLKNIGVLDSQYGKGVTIKHLVKSSLLSIPIPVPPLPEQEKIVSELDCLSDIIEKKRQQLKELDALAQSIFYEMFGNPVENERGWEVKKLGEVAYIGLGFTHTPEYVEEGVAFLSVKDISSGEICWDKIKYVSQQEYESAPKGAKPKKGDIMFCRVGTMGKPVIVDTDIPFCTFVSLGYLHLLDSNVNNVYVKYWMLSHAFDEQVEKNVKGIAVKNLNTGWLKTFEIQVPPLLLQQSFAQKIESIEKQKELIKQSIAEVETLFNSRMDYYFN